MICTACLHKIHQIVFFRNKKYLSNIHGQPLLLSWHGQRGGSFNGVAQLSYLCVSVLRNYGCFVAQYELFDNGSHARQSCHLSRAVGPPPPPKQQQKKWRNRSKPFSFKSPGITTCHLAPRIFETSYSPVEDGRATTAAPPPVGGGGGGDQQRFDGYSSP